MNSWNSLSKNKGNKISNYKKRNRKTNTNKNQLLRTIKWYEGKGIKINIIGIYNLNIVYHSHQMKNLKRTNFRALMINIIFF